MKTFKFSASVERMVNEEVYMEVRAENEEDAGVICRSLLEATPLPPGVKGETRTYLTESRTALSSTVTRLEPYAEEDYAS